MADIVERLRAWSRDLQTGRNCFDADQDLKKAADEIERLRAALQELMEFVDEYSDVVDGDDGVPEPNRAMSLLVMARDVLKEPNR